MRAPATAVIEYENDMKRLLFVSLLVGISMSDPLQGIGLLEWIDALSPAVRRSDEPLTLFRMPGDSGPGRIYPLERFAPSSGLDCGDYVYSFGELSEALGVEALDPGTGVPYLLLISAALPRKVLTAQPLALGADGHVLVVRENPAVTPRLLYARVRELDEGVLSGRSFAIFDARGIRSLRDLGRPELFDRIVSETNEYTALPATHGFAAQMAYYHLSQAQERISSIGVPVPPGPAPVFVNVAGLERGLYQRRSPFLLAFGQHIADDADLVAHEYGHAVVDQLNPSLILEGENQFGAAIHEAFGDFLAFAMHGNPIIGEWGSVEPRTIQNHARYPDDCLDAKLGRYDPYVASRVLSGLFYDLSKKIGRTKALGLFADAVRHLPPAPTLYDLRTSVLEAAGPRIRQTEIETLFDERGIDARSISNDSAVLSGERLSIRDGRGRESDRFEHHAQIQVVVEGQIRMTRPGYNLLGDLELLGPAGFERTTILFNGRWPSTDGSIVAPLGRVVLRGAPPGTYQLRVRVKIGGSDRVAYLTRTFTVQ